MEIEMEKAQRFVEQAKIDLRKKDKKIKLLKKSKNSPVVGMTSSSRRQEHFSSPESRKSTSGEDNVYAQYSGKLEYDRESIENE